MLDPAFGLLIVIGTALLFAAAALPKFRDPARFAGIVTAYRVLPGSIAGPVACLIPCLEAAIAAGLLWQSTRKVAVIGAMVLLLGYAAALGLNLRRGRLDLDCGCGAARDRRPIAAWMVWRNVLIAAALAIAALPWSPRILDFTDSLTLIGGIAAAVTLYAAADRLFGEVAPKALMLRSRP